MPVYKDKERGTWYAMFYYTDWQGVKHKKKKRGFKTQREAKEYERDFLANEQKDCDVTFKTLVEEYFADMKTRLRETTIVNKQYLFDTKITPFLGRLKIKDITPTTIRKWQNEVLLSGEYSPTYIKTINNQLSAIFNYAVRYYDLPKNPCHVAGSVGKKNADEMNIWTQEEFEQFIAVEDKPASKLAFEILYWTGMRSGELLALTPADVLPDKSININKSFTRLNGEDLISEPKTPKGNRNVPIPDFLYDEIFEYTSSVYKIEPDERIFYFTKSHLSTEMKRCCQLSGVKKIRVHDLRHSHASMLINEGYNALFVSERLGHENIETTLNTYSHLFPNKHRELADNLNKKRSLDN